MELVACSKCSKYVSHKIIGTYGVVICAYWSDGVHDRPLWRSAKDNQYYVNCPDGAKSLIFNPHTLNLPICKETLSEPERLRGTCTEQSRSVAGEVS